MFRKWQVTPIAAAILAFTTLALASGLPSDQPRTCADTLNQPHRLRISLVAGSSLEESVMDRARLEVEEIWRPYHIEIVWTTEDEGNDAPPDLVLQFVEGMPAHSAHAIAWVFFHENRPLPYVRVSLAAALRLMMGSNWFDGQPIKLAPLSTQRMALGRILGRAIAHEIGHVMLESRLHASAGLMRAMIDPAQLVRPGLDFFGLATGEVRTLRAARLARCEFARASLAAAW